MMHKMVRFSPELIQPELPGLWRYAHALPQVDSRAVISLGEVMTPIAKLSFGSLQLSVKLDFMFPSGSYKDRGATVMMSQAYAQGISHVVQDSSGNAGCAVAAYAAKAGIACDIYVPVDVSQSKLAQLQGYGASIKLIDGSREATSIAAQEAARSSYYASHCFNPLFLQGTKTFAFEIAEQCNWKIPDTLLIPAGNGTLLLGCYIGFSELLQSAVIDHMPRLIAVQSERVAPLYAAWKGMSPSPFQPTVAEGIAIANPPLIKEMLEAVHQTNGMVVTVSDDEVTAAKLLAGSMGYYIEPTAAAAFAASLNYCKENPDKEVLTVFTGNGLKK